MAVPVSLDRNQVRSILSLYHLEGPDDFGGVCAGLRSYWVEASGRKFYLRISDRRRIDEMIFEKEVLAQLERHDVPVPRLIRNVAHGTFTPWSARGRYVSLFEFMPGRRLGVFELRPKHLRSVGQLCARMHRALEGFSRRRTHAHGLVTMAGGIDRLRRAYDRRRLARRFGPDIDALEDALDAQLRVDREAVPRGTVHSDLSIENLRFDHARLVGVVGFAEAATTRWIWDLAVVTLAWCWCPSARAGLGPTGHFDPDRVKSLLRAYHKMRPFTDEEQAVLPHELRLVAIHEASTRMWGSEIRRKSKAPHLYRDYRHYMARLHALEGGEAERLVEAAL